MSGCGMQWKRADQQGGSLRGISLPVISPSEVVSKFEGVVLVLGAVRRGRTYCQGSARPTVTNVLCVRQAVGHRCELRQGNTRARPDLGNLALSQGEQLGPQRTPF